MNNGIKQALKQMNIDAIGILRTRRRIFGQLSQATYKNLTKSRVSTSPIANSEGLQCGHGDQMNRLQKIDQRSSNISPTRQDDNYCTNLDDVDNLQKFRL